MRTFFRSHLAALILITLTAIALIAAVVTTTLKPPHAVALAVGAVTLILTVQYLGQGFDMTWRKDTTTRRAGARDETSELAWMLFGRDSSISFGGHRYLYGVAQRVLSAKGLDLTNPADQPVLTELLGARAVQGLTAANTTLDLKDVAHITTVLEDLIAQPNQRNTHV